VTLKQKLPTPRLLAFKVMSIERNLRLSPTNMQLLTHGNASFTLSSIATGGTFSPPAVIINSATKQHYITTL